LKIKKKKIEDKQKKEKKIEDKENIQEKKD